MARIEPFKGLRPRKEIAHKVASPPYDVLNTEEAKELASDNDFSFLHVIKPEIDLPENIDLYSDQVYQKAAAEGFIAYATRRSLSKLTTTPPDFVVIDPPQTPVISIDKTNLYFGDYFHIMVI